MTVWVEEVRKGMCGPLIALLSLKIKCCLCFGLISLLESSWSRWVCVVIYFLRARIIHDLKWLEQLVVITWLLYSDYSCLCQVMFLLVLCWEVWVDIRQKFYPGCSAIFFQHLSAYHLHAIVIVLICFYLHSNIFSLVDSKLHLAVSNSFFFIWLRVQISFVI